MTWWYDFKYGYRSDCQVALLKLTDRHADMQKTHDCWTHLKTKQAFQKVSATAKGSYWQTYQKVHCWTAYFNLGNMDFCMYLNLITNGIVFEYSVMYCPRPCSSPRCRMVLRSASWSSWMDPREQLKYQKYQKHSDKRDTNIFSFIYAWI